MLADMIDWHVRGTVTGSVWMRRRVDSCRRTGRNSPGWTPRSADWSGDAAYRQAVEINALWYNALMIMADFAERLGRPSVPLRGTRSQGAPVSSISFVRWGGSAFSDVLDGPTGDDPTSRPIKSSPSARRCQSAGLQKPSKPLVPHLDGNC